MKIRLRKKEAAPPVATATLTVACNTRAVVAVRSEVSGRAYLAHKIVTCATDKAVYFTGKSVRAVDHGRNQYRPTFCKKFSVRTSWSRCSDCKYKEAIRLVGHSLMASELLRPAIRSLPILLSRAGKSYT